MRLAGQEERLSRRVRWPKSYRSENIETARGFPIRATSLQVARGRQRCRRALPESKLITPRFFYFAMRPCITSKCPFDILPSSRTSHFGEGITTEEMKELCWLRPKLVAQISFTEWMNYGLLRHAHSK